MIIKGHRFARFGYGSPVAGLHWRIVTTEIRCHAVTFTFTGSDSSTLDAAARKMNGLAFAEAIGNGKQGNDPPVCIAGYAAGANAPDNVEPRLTNHHFNTIPARIIIDNDGNVRHVHLLSAFPEQSEIITAALLRWRFKPDIQDGHPVEVETGIVFRPPPPHRATSGIPARIRPRS
ncbi:MAG: energy transducer TonB [Thermoanaerobaculia bacterium]